MVTWTGDVHVNPEEERGGFRTCDVGSEQAPTTLQNS